MNSIRTRFLRRIPTTRPYLLARELTCSLLFMLSKSDFPISEAIQLFAGFGIQAAYFVPTRTGLEKSILDAHQGVREFLKASKIHDFESQGQGGAEHGVTVKVNLLKADSIDQRDLSLYRPKTKDGDPRMWVNIRGYAHANNLLAFFIGGDGALYLFNCSDTTLQDLAKNPNSKVGGVLQGGSKRPNTDVLLTLLREIASRGWVDATKAGDTGIGHTLETLLGIPANSSKKPDFLEDIELKSGRRPATGRAKSKSTLLSKVPNWSLSNMSASQILTKFGEISQKTGRQELYVTVAGVPNRQGLYLIYGEEKALVENRAIESGSDVPVVVWQVTDLQEDIRNKHRETFWVQAESRITSSGLEQFQFTKATRTLSPLVGNLGPLINEGIITLDYTLSEKPGGKVRDHGYLFRIWPKDLGLLFPAVESYDLI